MSGRKTLQELTIKDNFMFAAVMMDEENCRQLLELVLGIPIAHVRVSYEKSIVYNPEYKGVRLDVFAADENRTHYNVEMQVRRQGLQRRSRFYHAHMDMETLLAGTKYDQLPESYVIFICDFDPYGREKYRYTVFSHFREAEDLEYDDGNHTIFLSTAGKNKKDVPEALVNFLKFVHADLEDSDGEFDDEFVKRLQKTIAAVKASREMGARYMVFQEMLDEEYAKGRADGEAKGRAESIFDRLEDLGTIPETMSGQIMAICDLDLLKQLNKVAWEVKSIEQFGQELTRICDAAENPATEPPAEHPATEAPIAEI